jgi:hypothetical protein
MILGFVGSDKVSKKTYFEKIDIQKTRVFQYYHFDSFRKAGMVNGISKDKIKSELQVLKSICQAFISLSEISIDNLISGESQNKEIISSFLFLIRIAKTYADYNERFLVNCSYYRWGLDLALDKIFTLDSDSIALVDENNIQHRDYCQTEYILKNQGESEYNLQKRIDRNTLLKELKSLHHYLQFELRSQMMNHVTSDCFYSNTMGSSHVVVDSSTFSLFHYPFNGNLQSDECGGVILADANELAKGAVRLINEIDLSLNLVDENDVDVKGSQTNPGNIPNESIVIETLNNSEKLISNEFYIIMDHINPICREALKELYKRRIIVINGLRIDFLCEKGNMINFFRECGNADWSIIKKYTFCKGKELLAEDEHNGECTNYWERIGQFIFSGTCENIRGNKKTSGSKKRNIKKNQ